MQKDFIASLKDRVSLFEVISRRVKLTRSGRDWVGLCPFHHEKTPSFKVSNDNGYYYCFGCGAHGDVITFVMESEKVKFAEAVEIIANMYGIQVPKNEQKANTIIKITYEILEAAKSIFVKQLKSKLGTNALEYLKSRSISDESIDKFQLGFSSKNVHLFDMLQKQGFSKEVIMKSGIFYLAKDNYRIVNRYNERLIFPIIDSSGRCVGFGGRVIGKSDAAKYINSPETEVFIKNHQLYGYNFAKRGKSRQITLVEGYMDVISMHQAGFDGAVAPLGTSISETQIHMCWHVSDTPIICLDGDSAGIKASYRWIDKIMPELIPGKSFNIARLPENADPDSLLSSNQNEIVSSTLNNAISLSDWLWDGAFYMYPSSTPEQKAALIDMLFKKVDLIKDPSIKKLYRHHIKQREFDLFKYKRSIKKFDGRSTIPVKDKIEKILLVTLINHPYVIDKFIESFTKMAFHNTYANKLKCKIIDIYSSYFSEEKTFLNEIMKVRENEHDLINEVTSYATFSSEKTDDNEAFEVCNKIYEKYLSDSEMSVDLQNASSSLKFLFSEDNWQRLKALKKEAILNKVKVKK